MDRGASWYDLVSAGLSPGGMSSCRLLSHELEAVGITVCHQARLTGQMSHFVFLVYYIHCFSVDLSKSLVS